MGKLIRKLNLDEVNSLYLPLRLEVLHRELHWTTHTIRDPKELWDAFDGDATHLGCFADGVFAGACRIIVRSDANLLPSGPYIEGASSFTGSSAELSKGMVNARFRGQTCFPRLVSQAVKDAISFGVSNIFLSAYDHIREERFYSRFGFAPLKRGFIYADEHISPPYPLCLFYLSCSHHRDKLESEAPVARRVPKTLR